MKTTKILSLLTALMMLLSFAACGTAKGNTTNTTANKRSETAMLTAVNPKTNFGKRYFFQPIRVWRRLRTAETTVIFF